MQNPYVPKLVFSSTPEWHVARRVAMAPTQKIADEVRALGVSAWLDKQIAWRSIPDPTMDGLISKHFFATEMSALDYTKATNNRPWETSGLLRRSLFLRHRYSQRYLHDQMVEFFSDLVYISASGKSDSLVCDFNRVVLRPHALGKFTDLLYAALTHPALLVYLDNHGSTKTDPNENLGRELLELHTVGVGNYNETDVRNSTLLLTGHSFDWYKKSYIYRPNNHYVGPLKIMSFSHSNSSASGGPDVLRAYASYLALHPATAKRIATRLYTRFVADIPSTGPSGEASALIADLANTYMSNRSNMGPVLKKLFLSTAFKNSVGGKWRRPQETFSSMSKVLGPNSYLPSKPVMDAPYDAGAYGWMLEKAGHMNREWPAVNGYPDVGDLWLSSNTLRETINAAEAFVWRWDKEITYSQALATTFRVKDGDNALTTARRITREITGFTWDEVSVTIIAGFLASTGLKPVTTTSVVANVDRNLTFALRQILSSPYFMVR